MNESEATTVLNSANLQQNITKHGKAVYMQYPKMSKNYSAHTF